jgi:hypothetical protein
MRLPIGIEGKAEPEVVETIQYHDDAITDLQQAIPKLKSQIDSLVTTVGAVTASSSSSSGSSQSITNIINNIGFVNPQQGVTIYATQPSDEGALIILSDASPIAVTLTSAGSIPGITLPWYTFFLNLGSGTATLTPATGTISYPGNLGAASMPVIAEAMALVYFDGTNFWAATVIAGVSGSGTTGYIPVFTGPTALGDSHLDDGVTTTGIITSSEPLTCSDTSTTPSYFAGVLSGGSGAVFGATGQSATDLYNDLVGNFGNIVPILAVAEGTSYFGSLSTAPGVSPTILWSGAFLGVSCDGTTAGSNGFLSFFDNNFAETPFYIGGTNQIYVQPANNTDYPSAHGYVGINNPSPAVQLDVIGDIGISGNIAIPAKVTGYHGTGAGDVDVQMSDGTGSAGNMAIFDAGGGLTDGGPPAGGGVGFAQIFLLMGA